MIPLSIPHLEGNEWTYVKECLDTGWISSAGAYVNQFEQQVADYVGAKYGVACMNGTAGLHIAQLLLGIGEEAHVLAPNVTFIATLNAISYAGAEPILVDVDPANWQMDLDLLDAWMEAQTEWVQVEGKQWRVYGRTGKPIKAIMPVHVLGNMGNIDQLVALAQKYNLEIIEDSTEALGSFYKGRHAGTFGKIAVFSFNGNKIFSTDGGGVIVTDDAELAKRAKQLEKEIEELEDTVKERKEQQRKLLEESIPGRLTELGMKSFKMSDGSLIDIKAFYNASIKEENRAKAYEWLRDNGFDDIIKNTVSVRFGRGEDQLCETLLNQLREDNYPVEQAQKVEPQTLKAWVREQVERGSEFPTELFGVYIGQRATIKSA